MNARNMAAKYGSKALALVGLAGSSMAAFAQEGTNPIVTSLDGVALAGVVAAIAAACVIIVSIALTMKGPDVAKRVIRKV